MSDDYKLFRRRKGMNLNLVNEITKSQMRNALPEIQAGMTIRVHVKIKEGNKETIQAF